MSARKGFAPILIVLVFALLVFTALGYLFIKSRVHAIDYNSQTITNEDIANLSSPSDETVYPDSIGANWKTYTNAKNGISIGYPLDLTLDNKSPDHATFLSTTKTIDLIIYDNPDQLDLLNLQKKLTGPAGYGPQIYDKYSVKEILADGTPANFQNCTLDGPVKSCISYSIQKDKKVYWLRAYSTSETINEIYLKQILSTLKFTN